MQDDSEDCVEMNCEEPEDLSHQKADTNQLKTQSDHEGTHSAQDKYKQPNGNGIRLHKIDLGIAKKKNIPGPLQACTSFRTSNTCPNGPAYPSHPGANVIDSTNSSVRNCLQISRTDHDCSEAEPEVREVPEVNVRIRSNTTSRASRCYKAVRLAFLQCLEETPIVVPGLVLTILFCVTIIVIIAATGRVSQEVII